MNINDIPQKAAGSELSHEEFNALLNEVISHKETLAQELSGGGTIVVSKTKPLSIKPNSRWLSLTSGTCFTEVAGNLIEV